MKKSKFETPEITVHKLMPRHGVIAASLIGDGSANSISEESAEAQEWGDLY